MNELKPYRKVITRSGFCVCAIYEPHPFRNCTIKEAIEQSGCSMKSDTGIADDEWCWVFYDWCGNPVGLSADMPDGTITDKFTAENIGDQSLADYLNKENQEYIDAWNSREGEKEAR